MINQDDKPHRPGQEIPTYSLFGLLELLDALEEEIDHLDPVTQLWAKELRRDLDGVVGGKLSDGR